MGDPVVSAVIPVYNQERYVALAIDSVLGQSFRDLEVIVVDDGSTDRTPQILASYGDRIRVIRQPNRGGAVALNMGIRHARGRWIGWLSSDDLWEPKKLERQIELITRAPHAGLVYTDYVYIDGDGNVLSREHFPCPPGRRRTLLKLFRRCFINGSSSLIRREVFEALGGYDERDRYAYDWDMWLRIVRAYDIAHVPEPLVRSRLHPGQLSANQEASERASRRVASRAFRRMGPFLGAWAALLVFRGQIRTFPAFIRRSVGGRTISRQLEDLLEWLVILVNPGTGWTP